MKILLTGATGLVGSHVLRLLLQRGYDVRALRRSQSRMDLVSDGGAQAEWVEADITDIMALESAFEGVTHVIHCAAVVSFHPKEVRSMMQINVEGTANLVNLSLDFGIKKFIHVSSIAALGRIKNRTHLDESAKWERSKLNSQYAISKYLAEQEVWRAEAEGLKVAVVNPSMVLGAGFWEENTARFFKQIDGGLAFCPVGATGFVDVRDVAEFMVRLLEHPVAGERFILNAENWTYRAFFDAVAQALGVRPPSVTVQPWLAELAWRVEWLRERLTGSVPIVTRESARSSVQRFTYDHRKSLQIFPDFQYRPLQQTIEDVARVFKPLRS